MEELHWEKLFSKERERTYDKQASPKEESPSQSPAIVRNAFDADYDRIVGSSSVRRLQDKAQVFPLQENDVARTRLTHSIEVSALAGSLGKSVGRMLEGKHIFSPEQTEELSSLLRVSGLIHDLGNPPFGHYGETVIQNWFSSWFHSNPLLETNHIVLTEQEKNDFLYFDGNVQNLRIVSRLQMLYDTYGANFTFATLGTIMKYPWPSHQRKGGKKKFGYFKSEEELAHKVRSELGLPKNVRHPATYLLEAADDIIYLCDDIEDGVKKGYIDWELEYCQLKDKLNKNEQMERLFQKIDSKEPPQDMDLTEMKITKVRIFRNAVQSFLFTRAVEEFGEKYDIIMCRAPETGDKTIELLDCERALKDELTKITARNCFSCREVLSLELIGDKVLRTLLDTFIPVLIKSTGKELVSPKTYAGKLYSLISPNFRYIALHSHKKARPFSDCALSDRESEKDLLDELSPYERLHLVTDFIAGMTDSYAVNLYQDLMGGKLP